MITRSLAEMNAMIKRARENTAATVDLVVGECPNCHGEVIEYDRSFACKGQNSCDFRISKATMRSLGKETITRTEMEALLRDEIIDLPGLVGKYGPFDCGGRLALTDKYGWAIERCGRPRRPRRSMQGQGPSSSGPVPKMLRRPVCEPQQAQDNPQPAVAASEEPCSGDTTPPKLTVRRRPV